MNSDARTALTSLAILLALGLIRGRADAAEVLPLLKGCPIAFESVVGPVSSPVAAANQTAIAVETVRRILREKNLARNIAELDRQREELRVASQALREAEAADFKAYNEYNRAIAPATNATDPEVEALRQQRAKTAAIVDSLAAVKVADREISRRRAELLEECPSGICVVPSTREQLIREGSIDLSANSAIPFRTPEIVKALETGRRVPEVFIVTHQVFDFVTEPTIAALRTDPRFKEMPRILLAGDNFKIRSADLYREATQIKHSAGGAILDRVAFANVYHFAGGFCDRCMTQTINSVVGAIQKRQQIGARFVFHSKLMYSTAEQTLSDRLSSELSGVTDRSRAEEIVSNIIGEMGTFSTPPKLISAATDNPMIVELRTAGQRAIRVTIER